MKRRTTRSRFLERTALLVLGITICLSGSSTQAAGLLIADGGFGGELEIAEQEVDVTINNGIAVTTVTQIFQNLEDRQVEALYTFPVPANASVANFSMWINGKEMIGEVLEKERAREIYNSYKAVRRDPGLLEQKDYKTFEMRIFPIGPKAKQKIKLTYYQELNVDHDWATYVYPLATETRNLVRSRTKGKFAINLNVKSEVPITKMTSPSHQKDFVIAEHGRHYYQASLETREGDLNRDVVLAYHLERPQSGMDMLYSRTGGEDGYFCLLLTAGPELAKQEDGMDFVFVLDISGSMQHDGKMRLSRNSVDAFIDELAPNDRFELITFNVKQNALFNGLSDVNASTREDAVVFLQDQIARGGTDLRPAVNAAYKYADPDRQLNVVILSDGMTEQGTRAELLRIIRGKPANARVFCIGVGNEVNRPLLKQIATDAGGLASFISRGDNFERQAKAFRRKLMRPAITNLKIDFSGKVYDVEPKVLPNLYHGMPLRVYGRYRGKGAVEVSLEGDIGSSEFNDTSTVTMPAKDDRNPEIERMWAWHKVQRLLNQADREGSRSSVLSEIVRLGEGYSIVTEYTSFLVLENDAEYKRWKIKRTNALRIERDRRSQERVRKELDKLRMKVAADLGPRTEKQEKRAAQKAPSKNRPASTKPRQQSRRNSRSVNWSLPKMGGGAIDPVSALLGLFTAGFAYFGLKRRRQD